MAKITDEINIRNAKEVLQILKQNMKDAEAEIKPVTYDSIIGRLVYTKDKTLDPKAHFSRVELVGGIGKFAIKEQFNSKSKDYTVKISDILSTGYIHPEEAAVMYNIPLSFNYAAVRISKYGVTPNLILLPANSAQFLTDENSQLKRLDENVYSLEFKKQIFSPQTITNLQNAIKYCEN